MVGERVQFDEETWQALHMLARDRTMSFQKIADEAFTDLLRKRPPPRFERRAQRSVKERRRSVACISSRLRRERAAKARAWGWMISTG